MSERLRVPPSHASAPERELTLEDVRRRLEGRMELIEAASKRYATLEKRLKGIAWPSSSELEALVARAWTR